MSKTERIVLLGMVTHPDMQDREVSSLLDMPNSTYASAKAKIHKYGIIQETLVPVFPRLGFELLASVYTDFNPSVTVEERVRNTRRIVEVFPELVLSIGASQRGFSISVARNITNIMRISEKRTRFIADLNLLEREYPSEILFPFHLSSVHRFFNLAPLISNRFGGEARGSGIGDSDLFRDEVLKRKDSVLKVNRHDIVCNPEDVDLTRTQLEVLYLLVKHPDLSASKLASIAPYSRHTISRIKDHFLDEGYLARMRIPNLSMLGFNIMTLFHARIDPRYPMKPEKAENPNLLQENTIFYASRPTEMLMVAAYEDYHKYNQGRMAFNQHLKENGYLKRMPDIRNHSLAETIWIKSFEYHPLIRENFGLKIE